MSRSKIKVEEKIRIAKACTRGELGASEAARQIGVSIYGNQGTTIIKVHNHLKDKDSAQGK